MYKVEPIKSRIILSFHLNKTRKDCIILMTNPGQCGIIVILGAAMGNFFHRIYILDISTILITIPILLLVWSVIGAAFYKYIRIIGAVMAVIAIGAILYITVLTRNESGAGANFIPFSSFERAKIQPEFYRSMLMNVFLFVPFGLALPFAFGGKTGKRI